METWIRNARALRAAYIGDPYRPGYHIVAPEGVCAPFDPNGALFWNGRYHLHVIVQTEKGHCWDHISSHDLVHWRHHGLSLEPGGVDEGIFSGGAFLDKAGVPTISYWGLGANAGICLATSTDPDLAVWTKCAQSPVIPQTSSGIYEGNDGLVYGAADPSAIWVHAGRHYMLTGNLLVLRKYGLERGLEEHKGDTAYLFVSDDLTQWEYLHPFYTSSRAWTREDEDNMCPDFFPLGDRHMLLFISHNLGCQYYLGRYESDVFYPEIHGRMTWVDNAFFAPESLLDDRGRRIMWAWVFDGREPPTRAASGWSGTLSLPRVLWLGEDRTLRLAPPEELAGLRTKLRTFSGLTVPVDGEVRLEGVWGNSLELDVEMRIGSAAQVGIKVCCSPDGEEQTLVYYDAVEGKLKVDTTRSSLGEGAKVVEGGPLTLGDGQPLRLRVFVDRSIVEVFANERQAVTRCIYPTRRDSLGVSLFARGAAVEVPAVQVWEMAPANPW
ncbi:MAG: glycoside hydrolase family 32 protein [Anaerolineae bacterium]|jgi:beta-fructofuranosidase|nr:glycoside hydrolase family 32 protein [Anaerolineae bacterium]